MGQIGRYAECRTPQRFWASTEIASLGRDHWRAACGEISHARFGGGPTEKYPLHRRATRRRPTLLGEPLFYAGPIPLEPRFPQGIVALLGSRDRPLERPPASTEGTAKR